VLEHFSIGGSGFGKTKDLQLVWQFGPTKVKVKSVEVGKGSFSYFPLGLADDKLVPKDRTFCLPH
jgi:hypothetical protein